MNFEQCFHTAATSAALSPNHNLILLIPRLDMIEPMRRKAISNLHIVGVDDGLDYLRLAGISNVKALYCYNVHETALAFKFLRARFTEVPYSIYLHYDN